MQANDIRYDLTDLIGVLGLPTPSSDEDLKNYWFQYERSDGLSVVIDFSVYRRRAAVIVQFDDQHVVSSVRLWSCSSVRVLDSERKILELLNDDGPVRCVVALEGSGVLSVVAGPLP
jgi:hypothetical protein